MHITRLLAKKAKTMRPLRRKRVFCSYVFIFPLLLTQTVFKEMHTYFVFYEYLAAVRQQQATSSFVFFQNGSTTRFSAKKIAVGLGLAAFAMLLANQDMDLSVRSFRILEPLHVHIVNIVSRRLPFLFVKCVLKCGVHHTWRRTSAFLNYECFHDHQVKLKQVHSPLHTQSRFQVPLHCF